MERVNEARRLILLPGLGADGRLFVYQRERFPHLETPRWLPPDKNETLPSYARRMAAGLKIDAPVLLGGASFGGMLAVEMAKLVPAERLFLISSAYSGREVNRWIRLVYPFARHIPVSLAPSAFRSVTIFSPEMRTMEWEKKRLLRQMLRETPPTFVHWASCAIMNWKFEGELGVPAHRIHGERDVVIPLRKQRVDATIPGGGHFVCLTHWEMVNDFIAKCLE